VSVNVSVVVESDAVVDAVRLGLSLKAECTVEYLLGVTSECRSVAEEVTDIELNAGLIGVNLHTEIVTLDLCDKGKLFGENNVALYGRENEVVVITDEISTATLTNLVRSLEIERRTFNCRAISVRNEVFVYIGICISINYSSVVFDSAAEAVEVEI
jgi:hypothetical protein